VNDKVIYEISKEAHDTIVKSAICKNCGHPIIFVESEDFPECNQWEHYNPAEEDTWLECYYMYCDCIKPEPEEELKPKQKPEAT